MAQHPTKAMISAYRALDAAYSKTHGRCCCTYRHGPWECPFVCQLCSKHAHEPWFMRAVHKPRFILAFRISRTTGTADHGLCTRFGFVNHDLCLFQRALLSSDGRRLRPRAEDEHERRLARMVKLLGPAINRVVVVFLFFLLVHDEMDETTTVATPFEK